MFRLALDFPGLQGQVLWQVRPAVCLVFEMFCHGVDGIVPPGLEHLGVDWLKHAGQDFLDRIICGGPDPFVRPCIDGVPECRHFGRRSDAGCTVRIVANHCDRPREIGLVRSVVCSLRTEEARRQGDGAGMSFSQSAMVKVPWECSDSPPTAN